MLKRKYQIILLSNGEKQLSIVFEDSKYDILSTFLFIEITAFEEWIKEEFDKVLSGQSQYEEINGNICCAEITPTLTRIYNNLADDGMGNWCEINTKKLRIIIDEWCEQNKKLNEGQSIL